MHDRDPRDFKLIAYILELFDLVAVQEIADDLTDFRAVVAELPAGFDWIVTDTGGDNRERLAFIYWTDTVELLHLAGELSSPRSQRDEIKPPGVPGTFKGFDRLPYLAAFKAEDFEFMLANVHFFFGGRGRAHMNRRAREAFAVGRWARNRSDDRSDDRGVWTPNIMVLGDMNIPRAVSRDRIFRALTAKGLKVPGHSTRVGSTLKTGASSRERNGTRFRLSQAREYDQVAFMKRQGPEGRLTGGVHVLDFDGGVLNRLWNNRRRTAGDFFSYLRYHISDHRPIWAEFKTN